MAGTVEVLRRLIRVSYDSYVLVIILDALCLVGKKFCIVSLL